MTSEQIWTIDKLLQDDMITMTAHHGDCVGADADFHRLSRLNGLLVVGHPPIKNDLRAFCDFDEIREPKEPLDRNHDIVDESDWMIFTPSGFKEVLRSGTWATIRYTRKVERAGWIVWPDGRAEDVLSQL